MTEIIDDINSFKLIKEACNRLAGNFRMPLLQYEWLSSCAETFSSAAKLNIVIVKENGGIKAIAPLVILKHSGIERLEFLGTSLHGEPGGFLYEDEESLYELIEAVMNLKLPLYLKGIRTASPEAAALQKIFRIKGVTKLVTNEYIPWLPVKNDWVNFEKTISSSRRSSLKRLKKIAEREGVIKFEILYPGQQQLNYYLDEVFRIESSGWKKRMGTAMLSNQELGLFFRNYTHKAASLGVLRLFCLSINEMKIAAQIGIEYSNRFWLLKIGYDEKWARLSPGVLLMNEVIRYVFEKKIDAIEFLGSDEPWLHIWTKHFHSLESYTACHSQVSAFTNLILGFSHSLISKMHTKAAKIYLPF